ncbi:MAG: hypothetical protein LBG15_04855 [Dysgonamonadaceae bacterium]|jgi:hypothetical protein|nr:hypothetical protein [Dysgonamonadaceae bacterium]
MAVAVTKQPNNYSFAGNPIVFELSGDTSEPVRVEIMSGNESKYATYYPFMSGDLYKIRMDLSDYLYFEAKPDIPESETIITPVAGFSSAYRIKMFSGEYKENPVMFYQFEGIAFHGGISNQALQTLSESGFDIFTYRLSSCFEQFLFTARTNSKEIKLKKMELYPFIFIHPGCSIVFKSDSGNEITAEIQPEGTVCAMDIKAVLDQMPESTKRIDVCPQGEYAFHFIIEQGKITGEKYLIRFRNSIGAFEMLEVTGRALHAPEFLEENTYNTLTGFDFYEEHRSRMKTKGIIEVETGYKERREFPFILDLIKSDESYFIYPDGTSFRCNISAENVKFRHLMTEPTSFLLKIKEVAEEEFSTPEFYRIFDDTFDETYN